MSCTASIRWHAFVKTNCHVEIGEMHVTTLIQQNIFRLDITGLAVYTDE